MNAKIQKSRVRVFTFELWKQASSWSFHFSQAHRPGMIVRTFIVVVAAVLLSGGFCFVAAENGDTLSLQEEPTLRGGLSSLTSSGDSSDNKSLYQQVFHLVNLASFSLKGLTTSTPPQDIALVVDAKSSQDSVETLHDISAALLLLGEFLSRDDLDLPPDLQAILNGVGQDVSEAERIISSSITPTIQDAVAANEGKAAIESRKETEPEDMVADIEPNEALEGDDVPLPSHRQGRTISSENNPVVHEVVATEENASTEPRKEELKPEDVFIEAEMDPNEVNSDQRRRRGLEGDSVPRRSQRQHQSSDRFDHGTSRLTEAILNGDLHTVEKAKHQLHSLHSKYKGGHRDHRGLLQDSCSSGLSRSSQCEELAKCIEDMTKYDLFVYLFSDDLDEQGKVDNMVKNAGLENFNEIWERLRGKNGLIDKYYCVDFDESCDPEDYCEDILKEFHRNVEKDDPSPWSRGTVIDVCRARGTFNYVSFETMFSVLADKKLVAEIFAEAFHCGLAILSTKRSSGGLNFFDSGSEWDFFPFTRYRNNDAADFDIVLPTGLLPEAIDSHGKVTPWNFTIEDGYDVEDDVYYCPKYDGSNFDPDCREYPNYNKVFRITTFSAIRTCSGFGCSRYDPDTENSCAYESIGHCPEIFTASDAQAVVGTNGKTLDTAMKYVFGEKIGAGEVCGYSRLITNNNDLGIPGYCCLDAPYENEQRWGAQVRDFGGLMIAPTSIRCTYRRLSLCFPPASSTVKRISAPD